MSRFWFLELLLCSDSVQLRARVRNTLRLTRTRVCTPATNNILSYFSSIQDEAQQKRWESLTDAGCWTVFSLASDRTLSIRASVSERGVIFSLNASDSGLIHAFRAFGVRKRIFAALLTSTRMLHCIVVLWWRQRVCLFVECFFARLRSSLFIRVCKQTFVWSLLYFVWIVSVF